jgi:myosin-7
MNSGWCVGPSITTEERGEALYILSCLSRPPPEILAIFTSDGTAGDQRSLLRGSVASPVPGGDTAGAGVRLHTREEYAIDHFRPPTERTMPRALTHTSARRAAKDDLWRHSRQPIRQHCWRSCRRRRNSPWRLDSFVFLSFYTKKFFFSRFFYTLSLVE